MSKKKTKSKPATSANPKARAELSSSALFGGRYWVCIIGPVPSENLMTNGADLPPRMAARQAVLDTTGIAPACNSGWCDEAEYQRILKAKYASPPNDRSETPPAGGSRKPEP